MPQQPSQSDLELLAQYRAGLHLGSPSKEPLTAGDASLRSTAAVAYFNSGANRSAEDMRDPEGFLSPIVLDAYIAYMTKHRTQADGKLRAGDNWQRGMPKARYMRSMWRHFLDVWRLWRTPTPIESECMVESLCALMFNVHAMLFEVLISAGEPRPLIRSDD
jgi:hypothetical protein